MGIKVTFLGQKKFQICQRTFGKVALVGRWFIGLAAG